MRRSRGPIFGIVAAVVIAIPIVAGARPPTPPAPPAPTAVGRWRIEGGASADGCGGRIVLAARYLTISDGGRTVFADVVDRTYRGAGLSQGRLVVEGRFPAASACSGTQIYERWSLRLQSPSVLVGQLTSEWSLPPDCGRCSITFHIRAIRER